jgi:hypothetical protein
MQFGITRVLDTRIKATDKILILLYDHSPQKAEDLQSAIEYSNTSKFRKMLADLHRSRLIERQADGTCLITPKGITIAEEIARG